MNHDIKFRWLTALTSGAYPVGTGGLRTDLGYCPLGVLLDVYDKHGWSGRIKVGERTYHQHRLAHRLRPDGGTGTLSQKAKDELGITSGQCFVVAHMNDVLGYSRDEIAKYIRENL